MSRVPMIRRSLRGIQSANDVSRLLPRGASTRAKETHDATPDSKDETPPSKSPNHAGYILEDDKVYEEEYGFQNYKTPQFTAEEKELLDLGRPRVDPRLSNVFRGYNAMSEGSWTIPYSKKSWYQIKQIYGHYDEENDIGQFYFHPRSPLLRFLRDPITLRRTAFDTWKERRDVDMCTSCQTIDAKKLAVLGPELLAAHFVTSFGGKVKFHGFQNWFDYENFNSLPQRFGPEFVCEAIDLSGTPLFYEGMSFFMRLSNLRSLNLANCTALDEWAIARLYPLRDTLIHLDLSGCHGVSDRGIITLWKMKKLRRLILSGLEDSIKNLPLIVMELEEALPNCYIHGVDIERAPNPQTSGIPEDYDLSDAEILKKYGDDASNVEWEKWWKLDDEKDFDADSYKYRWRGREFKNDWEDIVDDCKQEIGWLYRIFTVNPWGRPKRNPNRRI